MRNEQRWQPMIGQIPNFPTPACRNNIDDFRNITVLRRAGTSVVQRVVENLIPLCGTTVFARDHKRRRYQ